jgi:hypothetical protein
MSSAFRRPLPARPDLDQQKKLAKELLAAFRTGDAEAIARVRAELPDKQSIVLADSQFVLAREYGFASWRELAQRIDELTSEALPPVERFKKAVHDRDAKALRRVLERHAEARAAINETIFGFDSPALVAASNDVGMVDVLLEFGADPNRRSDWWAGGFHALHGARGAAAERLLAGGAIPDACAAARLDRPDLLATMLASDPTRVHERGGDGKMPLHFATSRRVADLLLDAGADIDSRDIDHRSTAAEWMVGDDPDERDISLSAARRPTSSSPPPSGSPRERARCSRQVPRSSPGGRDRGTTPRSRRAATTSTCGPSARTCRRSRWRRSSGSSTRSRS